MNGVHFVASSRSHSPQSSLILPMKLFCIFDVSRIKNNIGNSISIKQQQKSHKNDQENLYLCAFLCVNTTYLCNNNIDRADYIRLL